ncbi:hypothetical protein FNV43_RR03656 [Rhamnella rubrinervis]|uniref:Uncharacterized protein n=1 Tax=Rhamnella rubrinervis TaxID=2594499 RepID=A0A8K0MP30_9ROSA|nr:hypothetical protein FNV43_RR03656 [Rhamnella rubrinervis]
MNPLAKRSEKASDVMQCETGHQVAVDASRTRPLVIKKPSFLLNLSSWRCGIGHRRLDASASASLKSSTIHPLGGGPRPTSVDTSSIPLVIPPHWGPGQSGALRSSRSFYRDIVSNLAPRPAVWGFVGLPEVTHPKIAQAQL